MTAIETGASRNFAPLTAARCRSSSRLVPLLLATPAPTGVGVTFLAATFDSEFSDTTRSYAGKGVVRYAW